MSFNKNIGGFFELEIPEGHSLYHDEAIQLSTGRACISLILKNKDFSKVYLPYYCCDTLLEPFEKWGVPYEFYAIDKNLKIEDAISLKPDESILYINYFGVKSKYVHHLINLYKEQLIIDNSHSFFTKGYDNNISFTTARKYFGVPDGSFLYAPEEIKIENLEPNKSASINHNVNRLLGNKEQAYQEFLDYEASLNSDVYQISSVSEGLLKSVNYEEVREVRNQNFKFFKNEFQHINQFKINENVIDCFCYPLLLEDKIDKRKLFAQNIFIPTYWSDVEKRSLSENFKLEAKLSEELLPLPIDHRYSKNDLKRVADAIKQIL